MKDNSTGLKLADLIQIFVPYAQITRERKAKKICRINPLGLVIPGIGVEWCWIPDRVGNDNRVRCWDSHGLRPQNDKRQAEC